MKQDRHARGHVAHGNGFAISRDLNPQLVEVGGLNPLGRAAHKHPPGQIGKLAASLDHFGFVLPILIDPEHRVVAGWGLVLAAQQLGLTEVPAIRLTDLSDPELRALRLALNRITEDADWDRNELTIELSEILKLAPDIELEVTGFGVAEIDGILDGGGCEREDHRDEVPSLRAGYVPVTRAGDSWVLGQHRISCGDASMAESYDRLLGAEKADLIFADLTSNMAIDTHVSNGKFASARAEPSSAEFLAFLRDVFTHVAHCSTDGAFHFVCTHWRGVKEVILAAQDIYGKPEDVCIWTKNAAMGTRTGLHYLSEHPPIFVFKVSEGTHINKLAVSCRPRRTDIWNFTCPDVLDAAAKFKLATHSSKPVATVADTIRNGCSRDGVILDPFGGTGTTLIAAEQTGHRGRVIEVDPILVDLAIERWQRLTGQIARHADSGRPFARTAKETIATSSRVGDHEAS
jgi:DNA modification methylase